MENENNLKRYRKEKGLTQTEMARAAEISERHYQELEYGKNIPNVYAAILMADKLNVIDLRNLFPKQAKVK